MIGIGREEISMKNIHSVNVREVVRENVKEYVNQGLNLNQNTKENSAVESKNK